MKTSDCFSSDCFSFKLFPLFPILACKFTGPESDIWLGLTQHDKMFTWRSTGESVSTANWAHGELGSSGVSVDSAVVMKGKYNWTWDVVPKSGRAHVVCQRGESSE